MGVSVQFTFHHRLVVLKATLHLLYFSLVKCKFFDKIEASHCIPYIQ